MDENEQSRDSDDMSEAEREIRVERLIKVEDTMIKEEKETQMSSVFGDD